MDEIPQNVKNNSAPLAFARMPRAEARGGMAIGDRDVPRRGKSGWLRRSSAWLSHRCPARKRGELHLDVFEKQFEIPGGMIRSYVGAIIAAEIC